MIQKRGYKMKLPEKLTIGGIEYKIIETSPVSKFEALNAEIDYFNSEIHIDSTMTDDRKMVALLHEVLHGACDSLGLAEIGENESAIQGIASTLYSTFKGTAIFS